MRRGLHPVKSQVTWADGVSTAYHNRVVRLDEKGRYEADPRHAEMLIKASGVELGNGAVTPGVKREEVDSEQLLDDRRSGVWSGEASGTEGRSCARLS